MEDPGVINKLSSLYIAQNIFSYIKDKNFQLKLFLYSKYYQQKLNISLSYYYERFINKIGFNLNDYLYLEYEELEKNFSFYYQYEKEKDKNKEENKEKGEQYLLNKKYNDFLSDNNLNKEKFTQMIYEIINNKKIKDINDEYFSEKYNETFISIYSPFFGILSKTKFFENKCTIYIDRKNLYYFFDSSTDYYIQFFDKCNKSNVNYSSVYFIFKENDNINCLSEFKINFNKIKKLALIEEEKSRYNNDNNQLFKTLFSFKNIENNLIYLKIEYHKSSIIDGNMLLSLNNFKSLKFLYLYYLSFNFINFKDELNFFIQLNNLEVLYFKYCNNILYIIENSDFKELKELNLERCDISDIKVLEKVKYDKLEILNLEGNIISNLNILENVNFKDLKQLNLSYVEINNIDFLEKLKFEKLEKLKLNGNKIKDISIFKKLNFKNLKHLDLGNNRIYDDDLKVLEKVNLENLEVLKLYENNIEFIFSDLNFVEKLNLGKLKELNLNYNFIRNINFLEKVKFENVEILILNNIKIKDINILEKVNFKELRELRLSWNCINNITALGKVNFQKLEILDLHATCISSINDLEFACFNNLKNLNLNSNYLIDINALKKYKQLEILNLGYNEIEDITIIENFQELKQLDLAHNKIIDVTVFEKTKFRKLEKLDISKNYIDEEKCDSINNNIKCKIFRFGEQYTPVQKDEVKENSQEELNSEELNNFFKEYEKDNSEDLNEELEALEEEIAKEESGILTKANQEQLNQTETKK